MKPKKAEITRTPAHAEPIRQDSLPQGQERELPPESMDLSPELIMNRASATTQILSEILEQEERNRYVHHWGINE